MSSSTRRIVKTLNDFTPIFLDSYCPGHGNKESTIYNKRSHLTKNILPLKGHIKLDEFSTRDVEDLIQSWDGMTRESKNNHLSTLDTLLKAAVAMKEIDRMPCEIRMIPGRLERYPKFYDFSEYDQLVAAAGRVDLKILAAVGLGGDEGMRCGEVAALKWSDIALGSDAPSLLIRRTAWHRATDLIPKTNMERKVPLTSMMLTTLTQLYENERRRTANSAGLQAVIPLDQVRLRDQYVFAGRKYGRIASCTVRNWLKKAQRAAGLPVSGNFHMLRHTFCSHLAARGVPVVDIKALAGHRSIRTTEKYMHNLPGFKERGIASLDAARAAKKGPTKVSGNRRPKKAKRQGR